MTTNFTNVPAFWPEVSEELSPGLAWVASWEYAKMTSPGGTQ